MCESRGSHPVQDAPLIFAHLIRGLRQCEDDPAFVTSWGRTCADITTASQCEWTDDNTGVPAGEACPISCGTGCALTFNSCWNQQDTCQNGGVCVNLPGVEAFTCDCPSWYDGDRCQTSHQPPPVRPNSSLSVILS